MLKETFVLCELRQIKFLMIFAPDSFVGMDLANGYEEHLLHTPGL